MRSFALVLSIFLAMAMPFAAHAKKTHKPDTPDAKLSCKQITGRMQVSIMELRGFSERQQSSSLSRGIQAGFAATLGNLSHGVDPQGDYGAEIKQLHGYNQRLVEKGCKSYDLDTELNKKDIDDIPTPTVLPTKKKKKPAANPGPAQ